MKIKLSILSISIALMLAIISCGSPKKKNVEKTVTNVVETKTTVNTSEFDSLFIKDNELSTKDIKKENIKYFNLNTEKSLLTWFCVTHTGYVKFKGGQVGMADDKIVSGEFEIAMDSIRDTDIDYDLMRIVLENTLKSDSFFNVKLHPTSIIKLTHIKTLESGRYLIGGNLEVNGISNRISFQTQIIQNDSSILVLTDRFYIDRTKWGVTIYSRNFEQTDDSFLFTDSVSIKVVAVLTKKNIIF